MYNDSRYYRKLKKEEYVMASGGNGGGIGFFGLVGAIIVAFLILCLC